MAQLRLQAAIDLNSTEKEGRLILRDALVDTTTSESLLETFRSHFGPENGVDLQIPHENPPASRQPSIKAWRVAHIPTRLNSNDNRHLSTSKILVQIPGKTESEVGLGN